MATRLSRRAPGVAEGAANIRGQLRETDGVRIRRAGRGRVHRRRRFGHLAGVARGAPGALPPSRVRRAMCCRSSWHLALILLTLAIRKGFGPVPLVGEIVKGTFWIIGAAMVCATIYLFWSGFAQRVLTIRYALRLPWRIAAAFAVAWRAGTDRRGLRRDTVAGAGDPDGLCPGALVAQPRSPYIIPTNFRGKRSLMNNLDLSVALATAPSSAFAELRERPRFWFPLLLLVLSTAVLVYWYYSAVDIEWLKDLMFGNNPDIQKLPEAERAQMMAMVSRNTLLWGSVIGTFFALPIVFLVHGFVSAARRQGHQAAAGIQTLVRAGLLVVAGPAAGHSRRCHLPGSERYAADAARARLQPLSLNELVFHRPLGSPGQALLETLTIPGLLSWALMIIGVHTWSQRSWALQRDPCPACPSSSSTASGPSSPSGKEQNDKETMDRGGGHRCADRDPRRAEARAQRHEQDRRCRARHHSRLDARPCSRRVR